MNRSLGFLILAHNEAGVIGRSIKVINSQRGPSDMVYVVADHCTDSTEEVARSEGAAVFKLEVNKSTGKGAALKWFLSHHYDQILNHTAIVLLDADTQIGDAFVSTVGNYLGADDLLLQCHVQPLFDRGNQIAVLSAFSELVDQKFGDALRERLGWCVRLRGTGMVLSPRLLRSGAKRIATHAEDIALTLILAAQGKRIARLAEAIVFDQKADKVRGAVNQRARWFRGQLQSFILYFREVLQLLLQGPSGWSLLASIFLRPKSILAMMLTLGSLALWPFAPEASIAFLVLLACYLLPMVYGLLVFPERRTYFRSLLYLPGFVAMWILSIFRSPWADEWESGRT